MPTQKVIKTGNSLAVTIPADFVKAVGIKNGQDVHVVKNLALGKISFRFSGNKQLPLLPMSDKIKNRGK